MIKVVYINNKNEELRSNVGYLSTITIGKAYEVFDIYEGRYYLMNDDNELRPYYCWRFMELKDYRKQKLEKLTRL